MRLLDLGFPFKLIKQHQRLLLPLLVYLTFEIVHYVLLSLFSGQSIEDFSAVKLAAFIILNAVSIGVSIICVAWHIYLLRHALAEHNSKTHVSWNILSNESYYLFKFELVTLFLFILWMIPAALLAAIALALSEATTLWSDTLQTASSIVFVACILLFSGWVLRALPFLVAGEHKVIKMYKKGLSLFVRYKKNSLLLLVTLVLVYGITQLPMLLSIMFFGGSFATYELMVQSHPWQYFPFTIISYTLGILGFSYVLILATQSHLPQEQKHDPSL